jgi:hypothetical protein
MINMDYISDLNIVCPRCNFILCEEFQTEDLQIGDKHYKKGDRIFCCKDRTIRCKMKCPYCKECTKDEERDFEVRVVVQMYKGYITGNYKYY